MKNSDEKPIKQTNKQTKLDDLNDTKPLKIEPASYIVYAHYQ